MGKYPLAGTKDYVSPLSLELSCQSELYLHRLIMMGGRQDGYGGNITVR